MTELAELAEMPEPLSATLAQVLPVLQRTCRQPWWLIGSAALTAWGVPGIVCQDIDLLVGLDDAARLEDIWAARRERSFVTVNDHLFRSRFARFTGFGLPVETMGGLELNVAGNWRPVIPTDRRCLSTPAGDLYLPSLPALIDILDAFGRDKDRDKARRARAWLASQPELSASSPASSPE
ncbi:MAG: hypothetical protein U1A22_14155 [Xanthomonadaceae bacterium]|nr:hypothetical protein [Xanthomonadaceae bacterium]